MANVAMDLRIGILGPLEVRVGFGEPVQVVGPRLRALLIRLAMEPDRVVLAGQLIDAVWDSDPPAAATGALQSLVSRLRRLLPDVVESHAIGYRMAIDPEAVDSVQFERLALAGRDELRGDPQRARELLREALALWRGPALADVATARFAGAAVARLEELRLGAIEDRIEAELATGSGQRLVAELDELVTANPLRERLSGLLVRALARGGRQADALGAYERLRSHLAEPHAAEEPRTNLRAQITSFVGRDDDIARITGVLGGSRLVTLTGPGGSGKTRLATEAAAIMLDRMPDGVWLAELGPVVDPVDLPQAVLSLFGARELGLLARQGRGPSPVPPRERIEQAIGDKRLLLVMDNCEHLVAPAAALIDPPLAPCPELRVLATSREPLGITGEVLHPVGPMAMPVQDGTASEALRFPAVRLFADRGAAARPGFTVDQATVGPVWTSAGRSTASRWRSSWPPPGCARSPPTRSRPGSTTGSACSPAAAAPRCRATRRSAPSWTGAGACSANPSGCWRAAWRCSPAARPWRRPSGSAPGRTSAAWPATTSSTCWRRWWRSRSWWPATATPVRCATRCWRRCGPTARSDASRPARTRRCATPTPPTSWSWRRRRSRTCAERSSSSGSSG